MKPTLNHAVARWLPLLVVVVGSTAYVNRELLFSGFDAIPGDHGDSTFVLFILEHWHRIVLGLDAWRTPSFFFPTTGTLAYSDALFLMALPYVPLRLLGIDPYTAFQFVLLVLSLIGALSTYGLYRVGLGLSPLLSGLGAVLVQGFNGSHFARVHPQMAAAALAPLLLLLLWIGLDPNVEVRRRHYLVSAGAGLLAGLFLYTSYYVGYILILLLAAIGVWYFLLRFGVEGWRDVPNVLKTLRDRLTPRIAVTAAAFLLALVPFALTYVPVLIRDQYFARPYALQGLPEVADLINVSRANLVWGSVLGGLFSRLEERPENHELIYGIPPLLLVMFLGTGVWILGQMLGPAKVFDKLKTWRHRDLLPASAWLAVIAIWLVILRFGAHSLWSVIRSLLPGAGAMVAMYRFQLVLVIVVVGVGLWGLDQWLTRAASFRSDALNWFRISWLTVGGLLVLEQVNMAHVSGLSKREEIAWQLGITQPPALCREFFVERQRAVPWYAANMRAAYIANAVNVRTINGYSGNFPQEWRLFDYYLSGNLKPVSDWLSRHGVVNGVCVSDLSGRQWRAYLGELERFVYPIGSVIDFTTRGDSERFKVSGMWTAEEGGSWTIGKEARLMLIPVPSEGGPLRLSGAFHAFTPAQRPVLRSTVLVNGVRVGEWSATVADGWGFVRSVVIPSEAISARLHLELEIRMSSVLSPASIGPSTDGRELGLALHWLKLEQVRE
jgi:hypothetical protein